jgi:hypothetical protein
VLIVVMGAFALIFGACGDDGGTTTSDSSSPTGVPTSSSSTTAPRPDGSGGTDDVDVGVYFAANEAIATAGRAVEGPAVARGAVEALLDGPRGIETEIGLVSEIPQGTELLDIDITAGIATVDLSGDFASGGSDLSMALRVAQVVFTLTQFDTVDTVDVSIDGTVVDVMGGDGVPVAGVDRVDFADVTPLVLVETPVPGQSVTSPLEIGGMANTFEATVQYTVTDGEGLIVDEGFTTATAGNGTFGTFSISSTFEVDRVGVGSIIAFEQSARDGQPVNVYEVPVGIG